MPRDLFDPALLKLALALLSVLCLVAFGFWWHMRQRYWRLRARMPASSHPDRLARDARAGLVGREQFDAALDEAVANCHASRGKLCVLMIELDDLFATNEARGRELGDVVVSDFASRVHQAVPEKRSATRLGADQIVLLLDGGLQAGVSAARRLELALARPYDLPGQAPVEMMASIGVACHPDHGARALIVSHAHTAVRAAQEAGGGTHAVYDPKAVEDMKSRVQLLADLRTALREKQLELFYQPKIDSRSLQVTAAEALIRWRHPTLGMISPAVFIPIAERHGLICAIGDWVIEEACRQAGIWRQSGLRMRVAINLSAYQMRQDDLVDRLNAALKANHLQAGRFTVEITESLAMENTQATQRTFERLRESGLHVAIDDFGAGQTSLAYLRTLPASELKLDISLVRDLDASAEARTIAEALIKLAHALQRRVVAEGVETVGQRDQLAMLGCDELQGFLFARPMSARAFTIWALDDRQVNLSRFRASLFKETLPEQR
jgi:diguanylate cyclase (GGDEF)-like protein